MSVNVVLSSGLPALIMDHQKERIKNGCQKILEGINSMSLANLDDQQVHSLVMMREIARGVVDDRDRKVLTLRNLAAAITSVFFTRLSLSC